MTLLVKVGKVTLQTPIHVMPHEFLYNLLLGRPCIHEMNVVTSMLHYMLKYIYSNKVYTMKVDPKSENYLQFDKGMESPLKILIPSSKVEHL